MDLSSTKEQVMSVTQPRLRSPDTDRLNGNHLSFTADWLHDPLEALGRPLGPYTVDDMERYLDDYAIELYNGWLVWQAMGDAIERTVLSNLQAMLDISARKSGYGQALPDQTECRIDTHNDIIPDASLVSWVRLENDLILVGPNQRRVLTQCPELVIESRSPSNTRKADRLKRAMYFAKGTQIVWDLDEEHECIDVYRATAPEKATRYRAGDTITCELLPGWRRQVADIFARRVSAETVAGEVAVAWRDEGRVAGRVEGLVEGRAERNREIVSAMLAEGMTVAMIARVTGLAHEEITTIEASH
jgi:Uma2 family endonuclease